MLCAISVQHVDPGREDVYLASVDDQERVLAESDDFGGRTVLRSQTEAGLFWLVDQWRDEESMRLALAMARTFASVAALVQEPVELVTEGEEVGRGTEPGPEGLLFYLVAEGWIKEPCLAEYVSSVREQAARLSDEAGFQSRLLLSDLSDPLHRWVIDEWSSEQAAYDSFQGSAVTEAAATRFLSLFAERGRPLLASGVPVATRS
jgi:quinol monooxygenase YgiN